MGRLSNIDQKFGRQGAKGNGAIQNALGMQLGLQPTQDQQQAGYYGGGTISNPLPRPPEIYTAGTFAPGMPIRPIPAQSPPDGSDRPEPRRRQYPVNINYPVGIPGTEMGQRKLSFATMRQWYSNYSVVTACVDLRVDEILALEFDIKPTKIAMQAMHTDKAMRDDFLMRQQQARTFFSRPDYNFDSWHSWMKLILQDLFIVDGACLYMHKSTTPGKGVLGSNLAALPYIAPDTIKPILGMLGEVPLPPNVAYQQYIWGVPRAEFVRPMDEEEDSGLVRQYAADQLMYLMTSPQTNTIYGFSGIEKAIIPIMSGLQYQEFQGGWFTQGSIPDTFIIVGDPEMPQGLRNDLEQALNQTGSDLGNRLKIRVLPADTKIEPMRQIELADQNFMNVLYDQVLMNFQIKPSEFELAAKKNGGGLSIGNTAESDMKKASKRLSMQVVCNKLKRDLFDRILHDFLGQEDMEWTWPGLEDEGDLNEKSATFISLVEAGVVTRDEARLELNYDPFNTDETTQLMVTTGAGVVPLTTDMTIQPEMAPPPDTSEMDQNASAAAAAMTDENQKDPTDQAVKVKLNPKAREQLAELTKLRLRLKRGKPIDGWVGKALDQSVVELIGRKVAQGVHYDTAVRKAKQSVVAKEHKTAREKVTGPIEIAIAAGLVSGLVKVQSGDQTPTAFATASVAMLKTHYQTAADGGKAAAKGDWGTVDKTMDVSFDPEAIAEGQSTYLMALAGLASAASPDDIPDSQAGAYAGPATSLYEQGYASETPEDYVISWASEEDGDVCEVCEGRDGEEYTLDTLPNWPGDGDFGGDGCLGGPNDRCTLIFTAPEMGNSSISSQYETTE